MLLKVKSELKLVTAYVVVGHVCTGCSLGLAGFIHWVLYVMRFGTVVLLFTPEGSYEEKELLKTPSPSLQSQPLLPLCVAGLC